MSGSILPALDPLKPLDNSHTMNVLQSIVDSLRSAGSRRWARIADEVGIPHSTLKKLAYHDLKNPGVTEICQPLLDYFEAVRRKQRKLPDPEPQRPRVRRQPELAQVEGS